MFHVKRNEHVALLRRPDSADASAGNWFVGYWRGIQNEPKPNRCRLRRLRAGPSGRPCGNTKQTQPGGPALGALPSLWKPANFLRFGMFHVKHAELC